MSDILPTGSTIGILGGGQLGRMLSVAASRLGYKTHIYEPGAAPAGDVAAKVTQGAYDDLDALAGFAASVDVITYEFENIPADALDVLSATTPLSPSRRALEVSQDRMVEKTFLTGIGLTTAPFAPVDSAEDLAQAIGRIGTPAILKTRRFGYDGKGQARIMTPGDADQALADMNGAPAILEGFIDFSKEISIIAARGQDGSISCYDPVKTSMRTAFSPPRPSPPRSHRACAATRSSSPPASSTRSTMSASWGWKLFMTPKGLVVNEIAPRVHNSGHWTQAGCAVDQFEQHIRAVTGWPLGDGKRHANVVMDNLIGDDVNKAPALAAQPGTQIHLYGKADTRPGRKMGHVNRVTGPA